MSWFARAACLGADSNLWFPEDDTDGDNHGREAKAVCVTCPVRLDCLVDALQRNEDGGIWGGAGEDLRRYLGRALAACTHDPNALPEVCGCRWCRKANAHFAALEGERMGDDPDGPIVVVLSDGHEVQAGTGPTYRNGPGATHGRRVTYNRGCRCGACCFAVQLYGAEQKFDQRTRSA